MNTNANLFERLKEIKAFQELDEATLRLLSDQMHPATFAAGEVLCQEGEPADRMFLIESGSLSVLKRSAAGAPVEITVLQPGEIAGELSLFGQVQRSATLRARDATRVWVLDYRAFQDLVSRHAVFAQALLACLSRHLRRETSTLARLLSRDLDRRFSVAFFDAQPYMETVFRERNQEQFAIQYYEPRLSLETVPLAAGHKAVCVFVNDGLDAAVVEELRALEVELIALRCAGFNQVDLAACARHNISVTRVPAYSPYAVAEHAVALMLALNRRIHRAHQRVREGNFSLAGLVGFDMHGKTVGIVGTGKIGKCLGQILAGFGCHLLAMDKYPDLAWAARLGVRYVAWEELLAQSDIISLHAPLLPETRHLVDGAALAKMKPGVMLINTSRGALINTPDLLQALKRGHIGYAGLDVYEEESEYFFQDRSDRPITDDVLARLMTFNNVMITGHQAFLTREALDNIAETTLANIREFAAGKRGRELTHGVAAD